MEMKMRLMRINKKLALVASLTAVVVGLAAGVAFASGENDTDGISPASTSFTAKAPDVVFRLTIDGLATTITCQNATLSGVTPASGTGLGVFNINPPSFTNCSTSSGVIDVTIMTNNKNGQWGLQFIDAQFDEGATEGSGQTGDEVTFVMPKAGMTFMFTFIPGCTITGAPIGPAAITGTSDDAGTVIFSDASFPVSASGCTASSSVVDSSTYKFTPSVHDTS